MLKHLAKPHGIVAVLVVLFVAAWAFWTFVWTPTAEVNKIEPTPGAAPATTK